MGKRLFNLAFLGISCFFLFSFGEESTESSKLTVLFDNIRNKDGKLYIFLYSYENQYPENPYLYFEIDKKTVSNYGTLKFTIPNDLARGEYAVSILDDENANDDLDSFLGIPTEGYAFSNNVVPLLSLPDYNDLLFDLTGNQKTIFLTLQYLL